MGTTDFFSRVAALNVTGHLQMTISQGTDNNLIVSVMLNNQQCGDQAQKLIPPLMLKGSADELNKGFFDSISTPLQKTSELLVNMETYLEQQEEAKKQSAMEREKAETERKEKEARQKKYKEAMQKVDELEKAGKFRDAWIKVPDPAAFPEYADVLKKRRTSLTAKFAPDLFSMNAEPEPLPLETEPEEENRDLDNPEIEDSEQWT